MKIDTTVTIPQLSQLSAERADSAGPGLAFDQIFSKQTAADHERCENFPTPDSSSESFESVESTHEFAVDPAAESDGNSVRPASAYNGPHPEQAAQTNTEEDAQANTTTDASERKPAEASKKSADDRNPEIAVPLIPFAPQPAVNEQSKLPEKTVAETTSSPETDPGGVSVIAAPPTQAVQSQYTAPAVSNSTGTPIATNIATPLASTSSSVQSLPSSVPQDSALVPEPAASGNIEAKPAREGMVPALAEPATRSDGTMDTKQNPATTSMSAVSSPSTTPVQESTQPVTQAVQPSETKQAASEVTASDATSVKTDSPQKLIEQTETKSAATNEEISPPIDQPVTDPRRSVFMISADSARAGLTAFRHFRTEMTTKANVAFQSGGGMQKLVTAVQELAPESSAKKSSPTSSVTERTENLFKTIGLESGPQHTQIQEPTALATAGQSDSGSAPVSMESFVHRMTELVQQRIDGASDADKSSVVLRLDPPELGRLNVHLSISNDVVSIRMVATDEAARQVIERQLGNLHQSLDSQGLAFTPCQVECQSQGQNSSHQSPYQRTQDDIAAFSFGQTRNAATSATVRAFARSRSALDYVA
ncbi:MAG: flagellar hook-length control protein FliK [Planctomycetaceae bacterium]